MTIYAAAVEAVDGRRAVRSHLQRTAVPGPVTLVAVGKAAQSMALGAHDVLDREFIEGDADEAGERLARLVLTGPAGVQVWGGETTVVLPPESGRGGRNQHLALAAATVLSGGQDCLFLSAGTDGTDGPTGDAGALVDADTLKRAETEGFDPARTLRSADAGSLLEATGDLIRTGPTGTNVMDLMLGLKVDAHG